MSKPRVPERDENLSHLPSFSPKAALWLGGAILVVLATVGAFKDRIQRVLDRNASASAPLDPASSRSRSFERLNPGLYTPPPEYGIVVRPFENSGGRKRIIYLVDEHPSKLEHVNALRAQRELYFILSDMIAKFGQVSVVFENLPIGVTADTIAATPPELRAEMEMDGTGAYSRLFETSDLSERARIAEEMVGRSLVPAGMFAMAAHREIIPLGSTTPEETVKIWQGLLDLQGVTHALDHRDEVPCDERGRLNLAKASKAFAKGNRSSFVVACYCGIRAQMEAAMDELTEDRYVLAPWREISSAADAPGDFVVVLAGLNHLHRSMQLMKDNGLGFMVVAPRALEGHFPAAFDAPGRPVTLLDDEAGTCAGYEAAALEQLRRQQGEAFLKWMMEE